MIELEVISKAAVAADGQPRQWRSFGHREAAPGIAALAATEFPPAALAGADDDDEEPSRRLFLKTLGASMALASVGLSGCRRPVEKVMPYVRRPEEVLIGLPNFYATAMPLGGVLQPLLVQSFEGRPTKVEGNPEHPAARGKSGLFAQASVLSVYDPDRARVVRHAGERAAWQDFVGVARQAAANPATRLAVLCEPTSSLTVARQREALLQRFPDAQWLTYDPAAGQGAAGLHAVAGLPLRPLYRFSQARTIVSFDDDFLSDPVAGLWNAREYADSRRVHSPEDEMSRLYVIESTLTPTGGMADHRLRMKASDIPFFAAAVARALGEATAPAAERFAGNARIQAYVEAIAEDARAGITLFVAGPTQPASVHALCARLNAAFGGGAVQYLEVGPAAQPSPPEDLAELVSAMHRGEVDLLLMIGVNPVYDAPAALRFEEAMARVPLTVDLTLHRDETAQRSDWLLPRAHFLEAWGDGRALDGTITAIQPLISPLYEDARSEVEVLNLLLTGEERPGYDLVRETFREEGLLAGPFDDAWRTFLHDGFLAGTALPGARPAPGAEGIADRLPVSAEGDIELVIRTDPKLHEGAFSNNAWLLEQPYAISKVTWDNIAVMSPALAQRLGAHYREGTFVGGVWRAGRIHVSRINITTEQGQVNLPVWVQPGHPDDSVTVFTGWGRTFDTDRELTLERGLLARIFEVDTDHYRAGPISNGVGVRVGHLRPAPGVSVLPAVQLEITPERDNLASTQDHGLMEGRPLIRMATLEQYRQHPTFAEEAVPKIKATPWEELPPIWGEERSPVADARIGGAMYSENQWGMTVDLNTCTGCSACMVACQAENNIPIVGKSAIDRGREMYWLRIDRYYLGEDPAEAGMAMQPMMCHHCDFAPCESVCPVSATLQSPDGLNEMVYNRCIGTRYCSNNCPYKVRRFNWFNWNRTLPLETRMQLNPHVTPRFRGVMEKCTWCVHRLRFAFRNARLEERKIRDGEVQTACQQACPSDAIVFGDLTDPDSRVSRLKRVAHKYDLLAEYNIQPRLSYLARFSNPNARLLAALG